MKYHLFALMALVAASCGTIARVDYDVDTDFSNYKSYSSYPILDSGLSDLDDKRILKLCDSILQLNGFVKSEKPDFIFNFYASEQLDRSRSTIGIGVGGGGRNGGFGVSGGIPIEGYKIDQQFTMDIIDRKKDKLIWQGIVNRHYPQEANPTQMYEHYEKVLLAIFSKFPPKSK